MGVRWAHQQTDAGRRQRRQTARTASQYQASRVVQGRVQLPRQIESDPCHDAVCAVLEARTRRLWAGSETEVPALTASPALIAALRAADGAGQLCRGLEAASAGLAAERRGLDVAEQRGAPARGGRISRLLLCAGDGAERFYRQVERELRLHVPRVLACVLDVDGTTFGAQLYGPGASPVKLVMVDHKDAVVAVLRALVPADVTPVESAPPSRSGAS